MAKVSWGWNLVHHSPLRWQRTCWRPHSSFLRFKKYIFFPPLPSHGKTVSLYYEALRFSTSFTVDLLKHLWDQDQDLILDELSNSQLFSECLYFQLAKLNFNSHFASLQAWISSPDYVSDTGSCTVQRYSIATMLHVIASGMHNNFIYKILLSA